MCDKTAPFAGCVAVGQNPLPNIPSMKENLRIHRLAPLVALAAPFSTVVSAAEKPADPLTEAFDDAWSLVKLYENPNNPVIQKLAFTGRLQLDYVAIEGQGDPTAGVTNTDIDYDFGGWRRLRGGFKATVFKDFTLHGEGDFNPDEAPVYQRLTDAYIAWGPCDAFEVKVGKQGMGFTLDGSTSSKELLTIDRNNLSNNLWFTNEYLPGITVGGSINKWLYTVGLFSQGEEDKEFGNFDSGTTWMASIGYDLSSVTGGEESVVALDYMFNEETPSTPSLFSNRSLGQVVSLNFRYEKDAFGFRGDLAHGDGFLGQSDMWGLVLMPYFNITDKLQAVFRYTYLNSDDLDGIRFARYETFPMNGTRGDKYHEAYAGLNYFFYGHKLKLQTGLQFTSMSDDANNGGAFDGWSWTTGLRLSW
jgi:phosphate-selective porin OprO and OprP